MARRDRPWVDVYVTILCGPFVMPTTDEIRQAVGLVAERYPHSRLTWGFDDTKQRWRTGRAMESVVVEREWDTQSTPADVIDAMARDESLDPPLILVRYPEYFGVKMSHSLGDGPLFTTVTGIALLAAMGTVIPWPAEPAGRSPLLRAACRTFGRNPSLIKAAVRDREQPSQEYSSTNTRPWKPSRRTVYTAVPAEQTADIYVRGKAIHPRASRFAVQASLLLRALQRVGMEVSNEIRLMVDTRHYLGSRLIDGNFFAGVPMHMSWQMTPEQISARVRTMKSSGRPLANQLLTSMSLGSALSPPTSMEEGGVPRLTFSFLGAPQLVGGLPYVPGRPPTYAASVEPDGPYGMTFIHGECAGWMILNAIFHDNVIDAALVQQAMDLIGSDPLSLLSDEAEAV